MATPLRIAVQPVDPRYLASPSTDLASAPESPYLAVERSNDSQHTVVGSEYDHASLGLSTDADERHPPPPGVGTPTRAYLALPFSQGGLCSDRISEDHDDVFICIIEAVGICNPVPIALPRKMIHKPGYLLIDEVKLIEKFASSVMGERYGPHSNRVVQSNRLILRAGIDNFPELPLPSHWTCCTHPEGITYLCYQTEEMTVFTNGGNISGVYLNDLAVIAKTLYDDLHVRGMQTAPRTELFLGADSSGSRKSYSEYGYYFVDNDRRVTFWLHDIDAKPLYEGVQGIESHSDINTLTSDTSTSPFDKEELATILTLLDSIEAKIGKQDTSMACVISRFMATFAKSRFYNFYGHSNARLNSDQTLYQSKQHKRGCFMQFVSWWLFKAPEGHAREFSKAWVDRIVHRVTWKQFMIKLSEEWQEYTLFATVLLNANVAFLSVPGVINGDSPAQSAAQIASYMSIIMSIGSILLGLLLVRQNRTAKKDQVIPAVEFLNKLTKSPLGIESLAYIYSLPYALLIVVSFVVAVAILVFDGTTVATRVSTGIASAVVAVFVGWSIAIAWESSKNH
ncbi:hypothetical protein CERSUDRAFT_95722 [Gelatoporia subvermispora B]|uniref:Uncharacterized protein n=1 Tax=Ceriporiopsis subvermispora (strain B) TaxID=914234 RepID=M2RCA5_CERS8|nr:hypothetical protein CERSUDRAFT_95722 [Gelatoporia subvermispora B]